MTTIAIADDHVLLRKSLALMIGFLPGFQVMIQAMNGRDLIRQLNKHNLPDIVLMDITMPRMDGFETARWLKQYYPNIKIIVLSMHGHPDAAQRMWINGARGYLLKDAEPAELAAALRQVSADGYYYNEWLTPELSTPTVKPEPAPVTLSEKELQFLRWTCTEKSHKEIAAEMCVSPRTVDGYRDALFRKLNVCSRVGIVMYALKHKIVLP